MSSHYDRVALFRGFGLFDKVQCESEPDLSPPNESESSGLSCVKIILGWFDTRVPGPDPSTLDPKVLFI